MMQYYLQEGVEGALNIKKIYKDLNQKYFNGSLPDIPVSWSGRMKKAVGIATVKYKGVKKPNPFAKYMDEIPVSEDLELNMSSLKIKLSKSFNLQLPDVEAIMIHEMVHVALFLKKKIGGHHDSPEFQNWIKKLRDESGLNIPMSEAAFKASPKLQAKDGYIMLIYDTSNKIGITPYYMNFIKTKWLMFAKTIGRMVGRTSKIKKIELYKVKHPIVATTTGKRSLKKNVMAVY